ncbi:hypothetical protein F2Q69_00019792 [Brassica cretica]|uniref:Uncharacterized protein n=1 Tax=Brassica cretica TaxID=69181 RepID=A0A8S9QM57_BRACR|nr:hypothetical protein F2Q69_00019792 [Brassica cretica]
MEAKAVWMGLSHLQISSRRNSLNDNIFLVWSGGFPISSSGSDALASEVQWHSGYRARVSSSSKC